MFTNNTITDALVLKRDPNSNKWDAKIFEDQKETSPSNEFMFNEKAKQIFRAIKSSFIKLMDEDEAIKMT